MAKTSRNYNDVRQLPSDRFQARYRAPDGRRLSLPFTFKSRREAERALAVEKTKLLNGQWRDPAAGARTFRGFADEAMELRRPKLAPRTIEVHQSLLRKHLLPAFGDRKLSQITPLVVDAWRASALKTTGPVTVRNAYFLLSAIMKLAVKYKIVLENPCKAEDAARDVAAPRPDFSVEDFLRVLYALPDGLQPMLWLMFGAHLRLGEACALERADLDLAAGTLRVDKQVQDLSTGTIVRATKTRSHRKVALPTWVVDEMTTYLSTRPMLPTAPLFVSPRGDAGVRRRYVQDQWRKAAQSLGLGAYHLHDVRHVSLTLAARAGATSRELMGRGGHRSMGAALRYQHAEVERDRQLAGRTQELLLVHLREHGVAPIEEIVS